MEFISKISRWSVDTIVRVGVGCCQNVIHMEHILHPPTLRNMINYIYHVCGSESFEIITELSSFSFLLFFLVSWSEMFPRGQVLSSSLQWGIISNEVWSITRSHSPTRVGQNWLYLALKEKKNFVHIFLEIPLAFAVKCHQHDDSQLFLELNNDIGRIGTSLFNFTLRETSFIQNL